MTLSVSDFLDDWFESEQVKGALAYGGTIGAWAGPRSPGTAYVLLHHRMGEGASGARGGWGFVRGGMGALSNAIADSARAAGAEIRCDAEVAAITVVEGGRATGVTLARRTRSRARVVASSAHPRTTFLDLVGPGPPPRRPGARDGAVPDPERLGEAQPGAARSCRTSSRSPGRSRGRSIPSS